MTRSSEAMLAASAARLVWRGGMWVARGAPLNACPMVWPCAGGQWAALRWPGLYSSRRHPSEIAALRAFAEELASCGT